MRVAELTRVNLPAGVGENFEVYVNGIRQRKERDFKREGDELVWIVDGQSAQQHGVENGEDRGVSADA